MLTMIYFQEERRLFSISEDMFYDKRIGKDPWDYEETKTQIKTVDVILKTLTFLLPPMINIIR